MARRNLLYAGGLVTLLLVVGIAYYAYQPSTPGTTTNSAGSGNVQVVAAENFWGSLASQLGGTHANVVSIVTDPNADPHEYETNANNATAVANAKFVIMNGAGYDDWFGKLVNASSTPGQKVLNVANLLGYDGGDLTHFSNEHFWYNPVFVNKTVNAMYKDFISIDPANTAYYQAQYKSLNSSLHGYMSLEASIKAHFGGTKVASTETIFLYMANATGLDVVSPFGFMKAVAEGNDPSAQDIAAFQQLLSQQPPVVKALVLNAQTVTQTTDSMKSLATQSKIPVVAVTETLQPVNVTFQQWMTTELTNLQNALSGQ
jgi:zinc/manganese transport system substrate-binding protein